MTQQATTTANTEYSFENEFVTRQYYYLKQGKVISVDVKHRPVNHYMMNNQKVSQKRISEMLGVSTSSVSNLLKRKGIANGDSIDTILA